MSKQRLSDLTLLFTATEQKDCHCLLLVNCLSCFQQRIENPFTTQCKWTQRIFDYSYFVWWHIVSFYSLFKLSEEWEISIRGIFSMFVRCTYAK